MPARCARRLTIVAAFLLAAPALASPIFDGKRAGLVLGGGLGLAMMAEWSAGADGERMAALALDVFAGYAWNDRDVIGLEANSTVYSSDRFNSDSSLWSSTGPFTWQSFQGVSWHHCYGPPERSFFSVAGLGFCVFDRMNDIETDTGAAWLLGAGHAIGPRLQVGLYYVVGRASDADSDFELRHLSLLFSGFRY